MQLRPYQEEAKQAILGEWNKGINRTLLVLPTGCGKTIVFAKVTDVNEEEGNERRLPDFRRGMAGYAGRLDPGPGK